MTKNQGNYHTRHLDNIGNLNAKHLISLIPYEYELNRGNHNKRGYSMYSKKLSIILIISLSIVTLFGCNKNGFSIQNIMNGKQKPENKQEIDD